MAMSRDRTIHTDDVSDVATLVRPRRGEVLAGVERRRNWSDEARIAIITEALEPGAIVSHVARRHDINPSQLFGWLKQYRAKAMAPRAARPDVVDLPPFAAAMLDVTTIANAEAPPGLSPPPALSPPEVASIEISIGSATVRIRGAADAKTLALVLRALKALA